MDRFLASVRGPSTLLNDNCRRCLFGVGYQRAHFRAFLAYWAHEVRMVKISLLFTSILYEQSCLLLPYLVQHGNCLRGGLGTSGACSDDLTSPRRFAASSWMSHVSSEYGKNSVLPTVNGLSHPMASISLAPNRRIWGRGTHDCRGHAPTTCYTWRRALLPKRASPWPDLFRHILPKVASSLPHAALKRIFTPPPQQR